MQDLESQAQPEAVFIKVPGIGPKLAQRIRNQLDVKTLPELEEAAHDGRLATVKGFGQQKIEGVQMAVAGMLNQTRRRMSPHDGPQNRGNDQDDMQDAKLSIELLLDIDKEYRQRAEEDDLPKIAPRRFNPEGREWLPIMNIKRQGWAFTVLFSNTARAHELEKTHDWVVIYYKRAGNEQQNTVVTESQGPLRGKRVVRGRGSENEAFYAAHTI